MTEVLTLDPVTRLSRDLRTAATMLSEREARYLVDSYYAMQEDRIRAGNQVRALNESAEPHTVVAWLANQSETMESQIKAALTKFAESRPIGRWALAVPGIGPTLAAGLMAHIEMEPWRCAVSHRDMRTKPCRPEAPHSAECHRIRVETAGQIWRFAGLDPTSTWDKGQKRPWNASLKTLCWKIGESFVKVKGREQDVYGKIYSERKRLEIVKNLSGDYADQAARSLETKNFGADTDARAWYSGAFLVPSAKIEAVTDAWMTDPELFKKMMTKYRVGTGGTAMLPPARIHMRAKRYVVKLFLAHYHHMAYRFTFGKDPGKPYIIEHGGHVHFIAPPFMDVA